MKRSLYRFIPLILLALLAQGAGAARLDDATAVPHLSARGQEGYRQFLGAEDHRAFAIAPGGGWGWSQAAASGEAALDQALDACQQHTRQRCVPYALDLQVVFDAKGWGRLWRPYATATEARRAEVGTDRGQRFPDLVLTAPNGKPLKLSSLRGQVVVLHFWATWCPTCRHELPQFETLQRSFARNKDLAFVFTQAREPAETSRQWLKQNGVKLVLHDSGARGSRGDRFLLADGQAIKDRQVAPVFPATYVLDRHGLVVFSMRGSAEDWSQYAPFLKDLLGHGK
ncbi:MAG: TlpA family protein disulfide reductase [Thiobacillus sp.]|nr:TlpA family protein disulfide reductase [Thiobacillus sp.]